MLKAVRTDGWLIGEIPTEYENDKDLVREAVKENPRSFREASKKLRRNSRFTLEMVRDYKVPLDEIDDSVWEKPSFVIAMFRLFGTSILGNVDWSSPKFGVAFAEKLLKMNVASFSALPEELQADKGLCAYAETLMSAKCAEYSRKSDTECNLEDAWDLFLEDYFERNKMDVTDFQPLFFDTFWYFRGREDKAILKKSGWHILSCLDALANIPPDCEPDGCTDSEFYTVRCLCEDLILEINRGMPGYYEPYGMLVESGTDPGHGCSPSCAYMDSFEHFLEAFCRIEEDFSENNFQLYSWENFSGRYFSYCGDYPGF